MPVKKFLDLSGLKFYKLLVLGFSHRKDSHYLWRCKCDCGSDAIVDGYRLKNGKTKSCGCFTKEVASKLNFKHGMINKKIYYSWSNMMSRCYNKKNIRYKRYGERGVNVYERWRTFINFYNDLKDSHIDGLTIDRYPNKKGNYEPGNVRWATNLQQQRNREDNFLISICGKDLTIMEWSEISGTSYETIRGRVRRGWDYRDAIFGKNAKPINELINV